MTHWRWFSGVANNCEIWARGDKKQMKKGTLRWANIKLYISEWPTVTSLPPEPFLTSSGWNRGGGEIPTPLIARCKGVIHNDAPLLYGPVNRFPIWTYAKTSPRKLSNCSRESPREGDRKVLCEPAVGCGINDAVPVTSLGRWAALWSTTLG